MNPEATVKASTAELGGYILAASPTIPPETRGANILARNRGAGMRREENLDSAAGLRARPP